MSACYFRCGREGTVASRVMHEAVMVCAECVDQSIRHTLLVLTGKRLDAEREAACAEVSRCERAVIEAAEHCDPHVNGGAIVDMEYLWERNYALQQARAALTQAETQTATKEPRK